MLASSLSHNGYTNVGKKYLMPVHQLEHALSGKFIHVAHACGLAILFPGWADKYYRYDVDKFARLGNYLFNIDDKNKEEAAKKCINAFREYFKKLGMPSRLSEVGVKKEDIEELANLISQNKTRSIPHHAQPLGYEEAKEILMKVL